MPLRDWIQAARKRGASDLHLESAAPPVARVRGELLSLGEILAPPDVKAMTHELLGPQAWEQFTQRGSADLSLVVGGTRCRINLFRTIRGYAIAIRLLSPSVNDLRACNLHPDFRSLINARVSVLESTRVHSSARDTDPLTFF
jgi:twitching motility protein PilT